MSTCEYRGQECGQRFSIIQKMTEEALHECPECGQADGLRRLLFAARTQRSTAGQRLADEQVQAQEPARVDLAFCRPEKFDELVAREQDIGGRLPTAVVG